MSEIIIDLHTITSAQGWYFKESDVDIAKVLGNTDPVLCFALVSVFNTEFPTLTPNKKIIALDEYQMDDLVGSTVLPKHTAIAFASSNGTAA